MVEDTANYTCIVSGPHNVVLASVTHLIQVRGRVMKTAQLASDAKPDSCSQLSEIICRHTKRRI